MSIMAILIICLFGCCWSFEDHNHFHRHNHPNLSSLPTTLHGQLYLETLASYCKGHTVIAFGDSLTHGYIHQNQNIVHPYSLRLSELLQANVLEFGVNGEATNQMVSRFSHILRDVNMSDVRSVVILGGTNDLVKRLSALEIIQNILSLHQMALTAYADRRAPIFTVAVTVPENAWGVNESTRLDINVAIRQYAASCPYLIALVELEHAFTQTSPDNAKYWFKDMGHFSSLGYDTIAEMIYEIMTKFEVRIGHLLKNNANVKGCHF